MRAHGHTETCLPSAHMDALMTCSTAEQTRRHAHPWVLAASAPPRPSSSRWPLLADLPPGAMLRVTRGDLDLLLVNSAARASASSTTAARTWPRRCRSARSRAASSAARCTRAGSTCRRRRRPVPDDGRARRRRRLSPDLDAGRLAAKPEPTDLKAMARALTRVRRLRYYPVRVVDGQIEVCFPPERR